MRIIKCAYSKTFPISQYFEKIYLEAELNEGDDVRKELYNLKKQVNDFFYESNAAMEKQMGTKVTVGEIYNNAEIETLVPLTRIQSLIEMINSAKSTKELDMYKNTVNNSYSESPEVVSAFVKKSEELKNSS